MVITMTSQIPIKINGKTIYAKVGGYQGYMESDDPIEDILTGYMIWIPKRYNLGLKVGEDVKVEIGGKTFRGEVKRWSRGAKIIFLHSRVGDKLTREEVEKLHREACEMGFCV